MKRIVRALDEIVEYVYTSIREIGINRWRVIVDRLYENDGCEGLCLLFSNANLNCLRLDKFLYLFKIIFDNQSSPKVPMNILANNLTKAFYLVPSLKKTYKIYRYLILYSHRFTNFAFNQIR